MVSWRQVTDAEPDLAARARGILDAHKHKTIATLRADGSPRISGTEVVFLDGEAYLGSMPGARKGADLRRDPRFALHSASVDPPEDTPQAWAGDVKLSGRAAFVDDPEEVATLLAAMGAPPDHAEADTIRLDITDLVLIRVAEAGDHLLIEHWNAERGLRIHQRY